MITAAIGRNAPECQRSPIHFQIYVFTSVFDPESFLHILTQSSCVLHTVEANRPKAEMHYPIMFSYDLLYWSRRSGTLTNKTGHTLPQVALEIDAATCASISLRLMSGWVFPTKQLYRWECLTLASIFN